MEIVRRGGVEIHLYSDIGGRVESKEGPARPVKGKVVEVGEGSTAPLLAAVVVPLLEELGQRAGGEVVLVDSHRGVGGVGNRHPVGQLVDKERGDTCEIEGVGGGVGVDDLHRVPDNSTDLERLFSWAGQQKLSIGEEGHQGPFSDAYAIGIVPNPVDESRDPRIPVNRGNERDAGRTGAGEQSPLGDYIQPVCPAGRGEGTALVSCRLFPIDVPTHRERFVPLGGEGGGHTPLGHHRLADPGDGTLDRLPEMVEEANRVGYLAVLVQAQLDACLGSPGSDDPHDLHTSGHADRRAIQLCLEEVGARLECRGISHRPIRAVVRRGGQSAPVPAAVLKIDGEGRIADLACVPIELDVHHPGSCQRIELDDRLGGLLGQVHGLCAPYQVDALGVLAHCGQVPVADEQALYLRRGSGAYHTEGGALWPITLHYVARHRQGCVIRYQGSSQRLAALHAQLER